MVSFALLRAQNNKILSNENRYVFHTGILGFPKKKKIVYCAVWRHRVWTCLLPNRELQRVPGFNTPVHWSAWQRETFSFFKQDFVRMTLESLYKSDNCVDDLITQNFAVREERIWNVFLDLTLICPCIVNICAEHNQQDATFHNLFISVRRSACFGRFFLPSSGAHNRTYSVRYLSDQYLTQYVQFWAPDDGQITRLKHVELTEINKLWIFASCWLYSVLENLLWSQNYNSSKIYLRKNI